MDDTTSPSSCEWHVIAEFEAVDCFWEDFEVTSLFIFEMFYH